MNSASTRTQILRQMETVSQRLESPRLDSKARMALLRRQAELGDLRDALAERARRAATPQ
jgi:cell division protein FtsB